MMMIGSNADKTWMQVDFGEEVRAGDSADYSVPPLSRETYKPSSPRKFQFEVENSLNLS